MEEVIVSVVQGKLKGKISTDYAGNKFYSFQGIPYAKPPVGNLRFKNPQAAEPWEGIRDATKEGPWCLQRFFETGKIEGGEDCLYLNVYTPQICKDQDNTLRPVMFWIHGGGYYFGAGDTLIYGPEFLLAKDVVLVTINYRLGVLGFLRLKDPSLDVPGNAGLKDIVLALRWVQANIHNFLGDSSNVTIFGQSAGSASVQYLLFSPLAKNLFHKAIMQSGSVFNPWASGETKIEQYAKIFNLNTTDEKQILDVLLNLSEEQLLEVQEKLNDDLLSGTKRPFGPCLEIPSLYAFLSKEPKHMMQSGDYRKIPLLIGHNDFEGVFSVVTKTKEGKETVHKDFEDLVPLTLGLQRGSSKSKKVAKKIKKFYYGSAKPSAKTLDSYIKLESDFRFIHAIQKTAKHMAKTSEHPVYFYNFCVDGELNFFKKMAEVPVKGASHVDDLGYLFNVRQQPEIKPGGLEDVTIKRMTTLWTNFAKYGNPTPKDDPLSPDWQPVEEERLNYLRIDNDLRTGVDPYAERMKFWDDLYEKFPNAKFW